MRAGFALFKVCQMSEASSFLRDLDDAVSRGTPESRRRALWHTTDLMITGRYSDDEIWTFGEVIGRLADKALWLDLRCLEVGEEAEFQAQWSTLGR